MDDQVVRDLVAMGRFLGSIDGLGVKGGRPAAAARARASAPASTPSPSPAPTASVRLAVSPTQDSLEVRPVAPAAPPRPARDHALVESALTAILEDIGDCKRCRLCDGRTKIVFGQGSPAAELMFVGEAPGADEDASGLAFVGRAGQLLTDMIEKGMRMQRADVYIANVIKCRPPGNRPPENDEISTCQPFLEAQIRAVNPRAIVALGATAGKFMAKSGDPISKIRGRFASWNGIPVMPTYHPAYLLRNPAAKKEVWADLRLVMDLLGTRSE
jgi:uracil-DNA glycosylase family 4